MTRQDYEGEDGTLSALNRDASKFQAKAIGALVLAVQIKILSKEFHSRFFLKVTTQRTWKLQILDMELGPRS